MPRFVKDPLIHFLLAGGLLFALFYLRGGTGSESRPQVVITAAQIEELGRTAGLLRGRELTREELVAVVEPAIREEILYREALALGLDVNDDEVRRRLVEKMQYLSEDLADPEPATEAELEAFFQASPERFRIPEIVSFDQIFFSPRERGDAIEADVAAALAALRAGSDPEDFGDRTPLQARFGDAPRDRVEVLLGTRLTEALFMLSLGEWSGPYESDFGLHLVRVIDRSAARLPTFEEVRELALQVYAQQRRSEANARAYDEMRARYDVVVQWPSGAESSAQ